MAVHRNGSNELIPNDLGRYVTPSYIAFTNDGYLVGEEARQQAPLNPENTIYDAKRLIGRRFTDPTVIADRALWPFKIVNVDDTPKFQLNYAGNEKLLSPEEASSLILGKLKQYAEEYLDHSVTDAVITVPAYFDQAQREATKLAAKLAGWNVLRIINEPTAAALAFSHENTCKDGMFVLVYDLGGGTLDVSIMHKIEAIYEVKAVAGNTHLGGQDFDQRLLEYVLQTFHSKHGTDVSGDKNTVHRLRSECENTKKQLTVADVCQYYVADILPGTDFKLDISRAQFENLNSELFEKTLEPIRQALQQSKLKTNMIDQIVPVGGSTRIPKVRELLTEFFGHKPLNLTVNPDEVVAQGAAYYAAILSSSPPDIPIDFVDVTPLSLGLRLLDDIMDVVIPKNTPIPVEISRTDFSTAKRGQKEAVFAIYEGENHNTAENRLLDEFFITDMNVNIHEYGYFDVLFSIDCDGILTVSSTERGTENRRVLKIDRTRSRLSDDEIEKMRADLGNLRQISQEKYRALLSWNELESFVYSTKKTYSSMLKTHPDERMSDILKACEETLEWLHAHPDASVTECETQKSKLSVKLQ
ncbi:Heat shock protein SSB [Paragonimus heterotremus]|uniref:Heat shock protein SSB n=1 Tax=Paragonimus heterotremus TaxID=100268 RepID=A0A8J4T0U6_9TREM|nr:Heat shock protein SSB [Paragonimus heterotremus]